MTEPKKITKELRKTGTSDEALMTYIGSYMAPREQEIRLHDAEFRGKHYFDFRFYDKRSDGGIPTKRGVRLDVTSVGHLVDAISSWQAFLQERERDV